MSKAGSHPTARSYLDNAVVRLALREARRLMLRGLTPDEAARIACEGAWAEFEAVVLARLLEERDRGGLK